MKILILSPYPERLKIKADTTNERLTEVPDYDLIISYGYRYIIPKDIIEKFKGKIINLHISYLPFNKGSDPNFWAWHDGTPHGVTIHYVNAGLDTGPIILRKKVRVSKNDTLATSYEKLHTRILDLFHKNFPQLLEMKTIPNRGGTYHRTADKEKLMHRFPHGWQTLGRAIRPQWSMDLADF